jgi:hypothetical protein
MSKYNQIKNQKQTNNLSRKVDSDHQRNVDKLIRRNDKYRSRIAPVTIQEANEEVIAHVAGQAICNIKNGKAPITNMFVLMLSMTAAVNQTVEAAEAGPALAKLA